MPRPTSLREKLGGEATPSASSQQATLLGPFVSRRVLPPGDHSRRRFARDPRSLARSPSAPSAATAEAYLNLTPLTDLCNQHEGRAHRANDGSLLRGGISDSLGVSDGSERGRRRFLREPEGPGPIRKNRPRRARTPKSACARRHRGPLRLPRTPQCRRLDLPKSWRPPDCRTDRDPPPTLRANGASLRTSLRCLPPPGNHPRSYSLVAAGRKPPRGGVRHGRAFFTSPG